MSYNAYNKVQQSSETGAEIEYRLFTKVTRSLDDVKNKRPSDPNFIKAIDWNRRMWSTFSSDCGAKGNELPKELRASIISLAIWVSKHSSLVMKGKEKIDDLISINRTVMEGLHTQIERVKKTGQRKPIASTSPQAFTPQASPTQRPINTQVPPQQPVMPQQNNSYARPATPYGQAAAYGNQQTTQQSPSIAQGYGQSSTPSQPQPTPAQQSSPQPAQSTPSLTDAQKAALMANFKSTSV